jgi:hypothetical protein
MGNLIRSNQSISKLIAIQFSCFLFLAGCSLTFNEARQLSTAGFSQTPTAFLMASSTQSSDYLGSPNQPTPPPDANIPKTGLYLAQPGNPIDVTIPDGMIIRPAERFTKTWRLVNVGKEPWSSEFALVWFSGDPLGSKREQALGTIVAPGEVLEVSVEMIAPQNPGRYQSNWKLRASDGSLFGLGPQGDAPFWVVIEVLATRPISPEGTSTPNSIAVVLVSDDVVVGLNDALDLDTGDISNSEQSDVMVIRNSEGDIQLVPINGGKVAIFGFKKPDFEDCLAKGPYLDTLGLVQSNETAHICYLTNQGLPGFAALDLSELGNDVLKLVFTTWALP